MIEITKVYSKQAWKVMIHERCEGVKIRVLVLKEGKLPRANINLLVQVVKGQGGGLLTRDLMLAADSCWTHDSGSSGVCASQKC